MTGGEMQDLVQNAGLVLRQSGQKVSFDVPKHIYTVAKREIPSVTTIIKSETDVYSDYGSIDQGILDNAADRGNAVHEAIERSIITGEPAYEDTRDDTQPYIDGYNDFIALKVLIPYQSEVKTWHPELGYAGTIDIWGTVYGKPAIVDIKTTYKLNVPACELQLSGYGLIVEWWTGIYPERYILKLDRKSGRNFDRISDRDSDKDFVGIVETFHARSAA